MQHNAFHDTIKPKYQGFAPYILFWINYLRFITNEDLDLKCTLS